VSVKTLAYITAVIAFAALAAPAFAQSSGNFAADIANLRPSLYGGYW